MCDGSRPTTAENSIRFGENLVAEIVENSSPKTIARETSAACRIWSDS
jgi:hypothetical protein